MVFYPKTINISKGAIELKICRKILILDKYNCYTKVAKQFKLFNPCKEGGANGL